VVEIQSAVEALRKELTMAKKPAPGEEGSRAAAAARKRDAKKKAVVHLKPGAARTAKKLAKQKARIAARSKAAKKT